MNEKGMIYTCTGRMVHLIPKTPAAEKYLGAIRKTENRPPNLGPISGPLIIAKVISEKEPDEVIEQSRRVYGHGGGRFEFNDLRAGTYYIVFQLSGWAPAEAEVTLADGQHLKNVMVTRKEIK